jgi:hypothetical protein
MYYNNKFSNSDLRLLLFLLGGGATIVARVAKLANSGFKFLAETGLN